MSAAYPPLVVGVVLTENNQNDLTRLHTSLEACRDEGPAFRVSWFNDGGDRLAPALAALKVEAQSSPERRGAARAHNRLMAEAFEVTSTRWYLCLHPDSVVHPAIFFELLAQLRKMQNPGLLQALRFPDESAAFYDPATCATDWCRSDALLVTRELFERVGGFDEVFSSELCADVDLSWRARAAGFSIGVAPRALVSRTSPDTRGSESAELFEAGAYLAAKWGDSAFRARCAEGLQRLTGQAPSVRAVVRPTAEMRHVADFEHAFQFTSTRW